MGGIVTQNFLNHDVITRPSDSHTDRFNSGIADPIICRKEDWKGLKSSPNSLEKKEVTSVFCESKCNTSSIYIYIYILSIERGSSRSHYVEESFWKRLWNCRLTDYW